MKRRSNKCFARARATTLIEVLAGLVILSTILAAMFIARGRFVRQQVQAQRKLQAIHALDQLVSLWMQGMTPAVPLQARGELPGSPDQTWRTTPVNDPSAQALGSRIVRVEVFDRSDRQPLITLDLLVRAQPTAEGRS